jgi:hypothetical protein
MERAERCFARVAGSEFLEASGLTLVEVARGLPESIQPPHRAGSGVSLTA